ncbi:MAG: helix-turn-helix domain-containing protein [Sulfitobacter sp.]|nr:helix-turn-helix domain-containing protein [Sulfitobacter sp.]
MSRDTPNPSSVLDSAPIERRGLIDVPALAVELGVTQRFVRRLVAEDRVPFLKIGKFVRFDPREIEEWVDECRRRPAASLR